MTGHCSIAGERADNDIFAEDRETTGWQASSQADEKFARERKNEKSEIMCMKTRLASPGAL